MSSAVILPPNDYVPPPEYPAAAAEIGALFYYPPHGRKTMRAACEAVVSAYERGEITEAVVLTNNGTETKWCQRLMRASAGVCFIRGRLAFAHPERGVWKPICGQMVHYLGPDLLRFAAVFRRFGVVLRYAGAGTGAVFFEPIRMAAIGGAA